MIEIKDLQGKTIASVPFGTGSLHRKKLMSEDYLLLKFSSNSPLQLGRGCYVEYNGVQYELIDFVFPSQNTSTGGYDYELRLDAYYWKWKNKILMYDRQGSNRETSWKLTQGPKAHMDIICSNLAKLGYDYNGTPFTHDVDLSIWDLVKLVSYEGTNIIDALSTIAETWDVEWWVENSIIYLKRCEYNTALNFELGTNVQSMSRSESKDNFATRIYAFGSTRNLPVNYRENEGVVVGGVVQKRLMLPADTPYVDAWPGLKQEEATEAVVVFDDVYPRRIGTVSSVTMKTGKVVDENDQPTGETYPIYTIKDEDLKNFEGKDLLDDLQLVFSSGSLNGMEFSLKLQSSDDTGTSFEINRNENYGIFLPNESLKPEVGSEYILYGFDISHIPGDYLPAAEKELKQRAEKYVEKSKEDPSVYECSMNAVWLAENNVDLNVGDRVQLINPAYFTDGRQSRIYGFEKHLDGSQVQYTVGNSAKYSRLAQVENEIKEIIYQGNAYSGSGGGVYVIGKYDDTTASDRNVFSALRSALEYVSKKYDDVVRGIVTFVKGIRFGHFVKGSSGAGIYQDDDGNWHIEGDYGHFRKKLTATEVDIQKTSHIGGKQISTGAEMVCSRVEEHDIFWRCFFLKKDESGNEIFNQFKEEDLAYVETFNLVKQANGFVGNHFYWRKVVGTGADYIDLSKSLCAAESNAPLVGDNIIQLGHAGADTTRQGAIIQASAGLASPYYRIYSGIKSFTLPEPDVTLSPHGTKIKSESIILEATGEKLSNYLEDLVADVKAVKKQADGMWVLWFAEDIPTPYNYPAMEWDTDELHDMHLQDIVVIDNPADDRNNGRAWRFHKSEDGEYSWTEITDKYLLDALNIAVEGRDTANQKRRNFVIQPGDADEYEVGDTWSNATWLNADGTLLYDNDSLVATSGKSAGKPFSIAHWKSSSKINSAYIKVMEDSIEAVAGEGGRLSTLEMTADYMKGVVKSIGFDEEGKITGENTSGIVLNSEFSGLFTQSVNENELVKQADISTFVSKDDEGNLESGVKIQADQIDFIGKTIINGNFVVDTNGDLTLNNITAKDGTFEGTLSGTMKNIASVNNSFSINENGFAVLKGGSRIGSIQITEDGNLTGVRTIFYPTSSLFGLIIGGGGLGAINENTYIDSIRQRWGETSFFNLVSMGVNMTFNMELPDMSDYEKLRISHYSFELTFFVPHRWNFFFALGNQSNENTYVLKPRALTKILNNNGNELSQITLRKGDVLKLIGYPVYGNFSTGEESQMWYYISSWRT